MLELQILDIGDDDVNFKYSITLYCKNKHDENIICHIKNFNPSFFIRVPEQSNLSDLKILLKKALEDLLKKDIRKIKEYRDLDEDDLEFIIKLENKLQFYTDENCPYYCGMKYGDIIENKSFYNFSFDENKTFHFYELKFTSNFSMMKYINAIKKYYVKLKETYSDLPENSFTKKWMDLKESNCDCEANLYESKVSPILKFIHKTNIKSCGWIQIPDKKYTTINDSDKLFNCVKEYKNINYQDIIPIENDEISNFKILSFDIECDSSHGDFPNPRKDFKKLVDEIYDFIKLKPANNFDDMFINYTKLCIEWAFDIHNEKDDDIKYSISKIYTDKKYDNLDDLEQALRDSELFKNLDQINDNKSRNKILKELYKIFENNLKYPKNPDAEIPIRKKINVLGDPIIQIGNVYYDYKTKNIIREIIVFKDGVKKNKICNEIPGIKLIKCKSEKDLLLEWSKSLIKYNPDYITGYNIFGFDFNFISERADILFKCPSGCKCTTYENNETGKKTKFVDHCDECPKQLFYRIGRILKNDKKLYRNKECRSVDKELSSSGLGDNILKFIHMDGRILFDMQKEIQKGHALESYKLDNVSSHFMKAKVKILLYFNDGNKYINRLSTKNTGYLKSGDYIGLNIHTKWGTYKYEDKKFKIHMIIDNIILIESENKINVKDYEYIEWCLAKDDISPKDIFCCHKNNTSYTLENGLTVNGPEGRALVAKYCVMDCELVIHLVVSLDIIPNNIGMANVCSVPQSFIFLRGQGVKVNSLITKWCSQNNIRIPTLQSYDPNNKEGFEGAIVLDPEQRNTTGMYLEDPVAVVDYASLYPSSIIENNFSHETFICTEKDYLENPGKYNHFKEEFKEHPDWYTKATYGDYEFTEKFKKNDNIIIKANGEKAIIDKVEKSKEEDDNTKYYIIKNEKYTGDELYKVDDKQWDKHKLETETTCYYKSQFYKYDPEKGPKYGIIPTILKTLLDERKATKRRIKTAETDDKKKVYECLQLQYKLTANSVYGQLGAKTSSVFFKKIAACTTAIGRQRIYDAENGTIEWAEKQTDYICTDENIVKKEDRAKIVYGDTDSVFIKFSRYNKDGKLLTGPEAIAHCIECGKQAGLYVTEHLLNPNFKGKFIKDMPIEKTPFKGPQDLEYEKTFENFILISKKRYIGDKHEMEYLTDPKRTSMGIVMKRRDNAPIVKYVYGNILEILMKQKNVELAKQWLKDTLLKISKGEMSKDNIDMFVITKSLRGYYKNPESIAHKVLADRIAERDPGNKPKPNDRIPYAYFELEYNMKYDIENKYKSGKNKGKDRKKTILQGNRIEHRDYIIDKKLNLDYNFYITNQIMKPVSQLLEIQLGEKEINEIFKNYID
jgi:DNA polymerase elongation subunit (family B)